MDWWTQARSFLTFEIGELTLVLALLLCGLGVFAAIRGILGIIRENAIIRGDAAALVTGELMPLERKKRMIRVKKRASGLRFKLTSFTIALVLVVEVMVSVPLYLIMIQSQRQTLVKSLWDRATVLIDGLTANARSYLLAGNIAEVSYLPSQMISIPEALHVTITGYSPETLNFEDQVWASNDPNIMDKIGTRRLIPGYSMILDELSPFLPHYFAELNEMAMERLGDLPRTILGLQGEAEQLSAQAGDNNSAEIEMRLEEIHETLRILELRVTDALAKITSDIRSEPSYFIEDFEASANHRYIFYKPIMFFTTSTDNFVRGLVRLEVSVNPIMNQIGAESRTLLWVSLLVALAAITIGALGAFILSSLIIRPIRQLVRHVETIRDTEDKAKLSGLDIKLKSRDELAILGDTINDMTHNLAKAAIAASDLSIGKQFQKKFIPLELDQFGNKLNSGFEETANLTLFAYYEGAKDVSGDYFDYQDLDGRYYAIIKCDVAGKGVPASFIMIQVATMFLNYFKHWEPTEEGMHIEKMVYQINEFIENFAFKDRFAAFTLCLYDSQTGLARFCNAGDNIVHLFDASEKKLKTLFLRETPAAGMLSNITVESKGGYSVQSITLDKGDMLLLFTDGIEESKRKFRSAGFGEIQCNAKPDGMQHENHVSGQWVEELGFDRMKDIINAVMNRKVYTLHKWHNPETDGQDLQFDFRSTQGTVQEVIMALISAEKVFRCYYDPKAGEDNRVLVDKSVDSFLREHFIQYRNYFSFSKENRTNQAYMYYTHLMEDEQYDDLTILGIKRK